MQVDKRDQRCVVVNVDPATGAWDPEILRTISRARQACLGVRLGRDARRSAWEIR
jgi:hypothetical protein